MQSFLRINYWSRMHLDSGLRKENRSQWRSHGRISLFKIYVGAEAIRKESVLLDKGFYTFRALNTKASRREIAR
jgi:hypothetical protein